MSEKSCTNLVCNKVYLKYRYTVKQLRAITFILLLIQPYTFVLGQDSIKEDPVKISRQIKTITNIDFFTTFSGISFVNGQSLDEQGSLYLYYNLTINNQVKYNSFALNSYYFTELGIKNYFDSLTSFSEDQYNFKNGISYKFGKSKFMLNISTNAKSQYFKHYDYKKDSTGNLIRYTFTDYRTPGYINYSFGIKYEINENYFLEFGLVNGRKTVIRNQNIFESREVNQLYGLERGMFQKTEYGLNLVITIITHEISKSLYFENFSQFNVNRKDINKLMNYKADINNAFHFKFLKHFRLTVRTKILYDINISDKPKIINSLTLGFYVSNTF